MIDKKIKKLADFYNSIVVEKTNCTQVIAVKTHDGIIVGTLEYIKKSKDYYVLEIENEEGIHNILSIEIIDLLDDLKINTQEIINAQNFGALT